MVKAKRKLVSETCSRLLGTKLNIIFLIQCRITSLQQIPYKLDIHLPGPGIHPIGSWSKGRDKFHIIARNANSLFEWE